MQGLGIIPSMYLHLAAAPSVTHCVLNGRSPTERSSMMRASYEMQRSKPRP